MDKTVEDELVAELAHEVLAELAPHELDIFPLVSEAYFRDPGEPLRLQRRRDDILGSGLEPAAVFLTPVVLVVVGEALRFLGAQLRTVLAEETTAAIRAALRRLLRRPRDNQPTEAPSPQLPEEVLRRVHEVARTHALQLLPEREAEMLALTIAGALVVGGQPQAGS